MLTPSHKHRFKKVHRLTAYKCQCGVWYGKTRDGWMVKDWSFQMVGQPAQTVVARGRSIWAEICGLFSASK